MNGGASESFEQALNNLAQQNHFSDDNFNTDKIVIIKYKGRISMYKNFKKNALKYYNPDGDLVWYRFTKSQSLKLLDELEKNNEILYGITIILNPSEHKYGKFFGDFGTDDISNENIKYFIKKSYSMAREYLKNIKEFKGEKIYYEITIKGDNLDP